MIAGSFLLDEQFSVYQPNNRVKPRETTKAYSKVTHKIVPMGSVNKLMDRYCRELSLLPVAFEATLCLTTRF